MQHIVNAFWQIVLLRRGPDVLPDSAFLLWLTGALYALISIVIVMLIYGGERAVLLLLADMALIVAWATAVLTIYRVRPRLRQTVTALFGAGCFLQLLALPLSFDPDMGAQQDWVMTLRALGLLLILLWSVAVYGQIIARAISRGAGIGVVLAVVYFVLNIELAALLLPAN